MLIKRQFHIKCLFSTFFRSKRYKIGYKNSVLYPTFSAFYAEPKGTNFSSGRVISVKFLHNSKLCNLCCNIFILNMSISIESYRDIRMSHKILQSLGVHTALCHIGTVSVPANVRRDLGNRLSIYAVILFPYVFEVMLPMKCRSDYRS